MIKEDMSVQPAIVEQLISLVNRRYKDWKGFSDPRFVADEVSFKKGLIERAHKLISKEELSRLINAQNYQEIVRRLDKVGKDPNNNLLFKGVPKAGDLNILYQDNLDPQSFSERIYDLLWGESDIKARLSQYLQYVQENGLPSRWPFPTFFLFVTHPDSEIHLRPSSSKWFLNLLGLKSEWQPEPSSSLYLFIKGKVTSLKEQLGTYGPQDMVDLHSFIWVSFNAAQERNIKQVRYFKISPGENARKWHEWKEGNFVSMGWDAFGDLSTFSREEFNQKRDQLLTSNPGWKKKGLNQVWLFKNMKEGDRIVSNQGTTRVLGLGTVSGDYYFQPNDEYAHHIPVTWDDLNPREVSQPAWKQTIKEVSSETFKEIATSAPVQYSTPDKSEKTSVADPKKDDSLFTQEVFRLLDELHAKPTQSFYQERKGSFEELLELPFQNLMKAVVAILPETMKKHLETERKLFSRIPKNDYGQGGAWDFYWGAFYPKAGKRIRSPQLFVWMNRNELNYGFYIGEYGDESKTRFLRNCKVHKEELVNFLNGKLDQSLVFGTLDEFVGAKTEEKEARHKASLSEWLSHPIKYGISAAFIVPKSKLVHKSLAQLASDIGRGFQSLFPFFLASVLDDPLDEIIDFLNPVEDRPELEEKYTLEQLSQDTSIDKELINRWLGAIERKKQAIIYGPPGTGKTFLAEKLGKHLISEEDGFVDIIQFHPSYAYEDFVEGIRPRRTDKGLDYPTIPGRFFEFCTRAAKTRGTCVMIIDEINRADLSKVFGELMYLLEYRHETIYLASGGRFIIPSNVRIIGTMNTADRSIALVDYALRRRFAFISLRPNYGVLARFHSVFQTGFPVEKLVAVLKDLNRQINDIHYEVGISFFLQKDLTSSLQDIWQMEIEPYLEEFFFDQHEKANAFRWEEIEAKIF